MLQWRCWVVIGYTSLDFCGEAQVVDKNELSTRRWKGRQSCRWWVTPGPVLKQPGDAEPPWVAGGAS